MYLGCQPTTFRVQSHFFVVLVNYDRHSNCIIRLYETKSNREGSIERGHPNSIDWALFQYGHSEEICIH
jgi:hypothetical protein